MMIRQKKVAFLPIWLAVAALALALVAGVGYAQTAAPDADHAMNTGQSDPSPDNADMPRLEGGAPNAYPIISYQAEQRNDVDSPAALAISFTYGDTQEFGQLGQPQGTIDIIGVLQGATETTVLTYSLNGGKEKSLSIGPDKRRLYEPGSFIAEIPFEDLTAGNNTVTVKAVDNGTEVTKDVTVVYTPGGPWPMNYEIDWSTVSSIQDVGQVVTGGWEITGGELKTVSPGYDRLLAIGDLDWNNYEITVPVTVESLNSAEWGSPSNGAGVGFITGWQGHYQNNFEQPGVGWRRALNSLSWYAWSTNGTSGFRMLGYLGDETIGSSDEQIALNTTYIFKLSVQGSQNEDFPNTYRLKVWEEGTPEPGLWTMQGEGVPGEPNTGSVMLIAHQAMVRFGDVKIRPISSIPAPKLTVQPTSNGEVIVEPVKNAYDYGERVRIRALGDPGFVLSSWSGNLNVSGTPNPIEFDITQDVTIKANFQPGPAPTLTVLKIGDGEVMVSPDKPTYQYGEIVTLTPVPGSGYNFAGWAGDLDGADNPGTLIMTGNKLVEARFDLTNATSPVSDDFNACVLNEGLWTFENPVGDGSFEMNGTQLILTAPAGSAHDIWLDGNDSVRVMQPTVDSSFEIITKFESVVTERFQMQGVLVEQDADNYLRIEFHHDGKSVQAYAAKFVDGQPEPVITKVPLNETPSWLRITRNGSSWSMSYSFDGSEWFAAGSFNHFMTVKRSGVYAGNANVSTLAPPQHSTIVDYFFNSAAPIDPEDGDVFGVEVNVQGSGNVTRNPDQQSYACGSMVNLTATPNTGWKFAGWSGDLSGTQPSQDLTITGPMSVTATFVEDSTPPEFKLALPLILR